MLTNTICRSFMLWLNLSKLPLITMQMVMKNSRLLVKATLRNILKQKVKKLSTLSRIPSQRLPTGSVVKCWIWKVSRLLLPHVRASPRGSLSCKVRWLNWRKILTNYKTANSLSNQFSRTSRRLMRLFSLWRRKFISARRITPSTTFCRSSSHFYKDTWCLKLLRSKRSFATSKCSK